MGRYEGKSRKNVESRSLFFSPINALRCCEKGDSKGAFVQFRKRLFLVVQPVHASSSIPAQRVLRHHRRRDLLPARATPAPPTAPARTPIIIIIGTHAPFAHPATHQRGRSSRVSPMLRHDRAAEHARRSEMRLAAFFVAAGDEEHSGAVGSRAADDADADADGGGFDGGGVVDAVGDGAAVGGRRARGGGAHAVFGPAVCGVVRADGEGWVDHGEEGADGWVGVVVEFLGLGV